MALLVVLASIGLVPKAIVDFGRSSLEGDRRGAPSGDLVFASTGASARRLLGEVVSMVPRSGPGSMVFKVGYLPSGEKVYLKPCKWWKLGVTDQHDLYHLEARGVMM